MSLAAEADLESRFATCVQAVYSMSRWMNVTSHTTRLYNHLRSRLDNVQSITDEDIKDALGADISWRDAETLADGIKNNLHRQREVHLPRAVASNSATTDDSASQPDTDLQNLEMTYRRNMRHLNSHMDTSS